MPDEPFDPSSPAGTPAGLPPEPVPPLPSSPEDVTPPAHTRRGRGLLVAVIAVAVLVLGGGAAAAFLLMRGASEQLVGLVPEQADVFATAYLDPSAGQKMNVLALADKFPKLGEGADVETQVNGLLDQALAGSGLTHQDVTPWLGSQIGLSVELGADGAPHAAALISTSDPDASHAAMVKATKDQDMRSSDYDGVEVSVTSDGTGAYAIVDDVLVVASDETTVKRAIDTAHGTLASLGDSQTYVDTLAGLPDGKLGIAFVNVRGLVDQFGSDTAAAAALGAGGLAELNAVQSIGMSVSAQSDGIAIDLTTTYDSAKLTAEQRANLTAADHDNTSMAFVPADAFAVVGAEHADTSLRAVLDSIEQQTPDASSAIDQAGIRDFIAAMNGDIAVEVGPGTDGPVSGAFVIGTDDASAMQSFLDNIGVLASQALSAPTSTSAVPDDLVSQMQSCTGTSRQIATCQRQILNEYYAVGGSGSGSASPVPSTEEYQGVTITFFDAPGLAGTGLTPAYAVVDGAGVIATSPEEIHQLIDTQASGKDVRTSPVYTSATSSVPTADSVFFLDIQAIAGTVRQNLPPDAASTYDREIAPNVAPLKAFVTGGESDEQHQTIRMFLQIT
jgi:hypothetical protein